MSKMALTHAVATWLRGYMILYTILYMMQGVYYDYIMILLSKHCGLVTLLVDPLLYCILIVTSALATGDA